MRLIDLFRRRPRREIDTTEAARMLSAARRRRERDHIRATARRMREEMGLPPSNALRDR